MQSQLEPENDLYDDEIQARNVCYEASTGLATSSVRRTPKKNATTQTFNGRECLIKL